MIHNNITNTFLAYSRYVGELATHAPNSTNQLNNIFLSQLQLLHKPAAAAKTKKHKSLRKRHIHKSHHTKKTHKKQAAKARKSRSKKIAKSHKPHSKKHKKQAHKTKKIARRILPHPHVPHTPPPTTRYARLATQFPQYARFCTTHSAASFVTALRLENRGNENHALTECCIALLNHPDNTRPEIQELASALAAAIDQSTPRLHRPSWPTLIPQVIDWYTTFKNRPTFTQEQSLQMALETAVIESNASRITAIANNVFSSTTLPGTNVEVIIAPQRVHVILPGTQIGRGHFKTVFRVDKISRDILSNQIVTEAVAYSTVRHGRQERMIEEFTLGRDVGRHQNHVHHYMLSRSETTGEYHIIQELCDNSLENVVNRQTPTTTAQKLSICKQFLLGMRALEDSHIIHNDIKKQNVLLQGLKPKIADFGLSEQTPPIGRKSTKLGFFYGTPACGDMHLFADWDSIRMRFEIRESKFTGDYSKIEKHACGNLLYEILYGHAPEWCMSMQRIYNDFRTHHNVQALPLDEINTYTTELTEWRESKISIRNKYTSGVQLTDREAIEYLIYRFTDPIINQRATAHQAVAIIEEIERRGVIIT